MKMKLKCKLPFSKDIKFKISKPEGIYAHENYPESFYAIDFIVPVNTPVLAIKAGKVIDLKDDSDEWGIDLSFVDKANFVAVKHQDSTYAEYVHLGKEQVKVKVGNKVSAGDLLGYIGLSGCMDKPHLHLNAFKIENGKGISIPVKFRTGKIFKRGVNLQS